MVFPDDLALRRSILYILSNLLAFPLPPLPPFRDRIQDCKFRVVITWRDIANKETVNVPLTNAPLVERVFLLQERVINLLKRRKRSLVTRV